MHASYRYLLIVVALAAMLCLLPAQGADAPSAEKPQTARETHAVEAPAGAEDPGEFLRTQGGEHVGQ